MDSVLGISYDGGVILAADQTNVAFGILVYQSNLDKVAPITSHSAMAVSGPNCDLVNFTEYVHKNLQLYELSNDGTKLSVAAQANFCRNELAVALRKGPFQVNSLLGGFDVETNQQSLYWLDYLGTLQKVKYGCQGIAINFCVSIMDRAYTEGQTKEQALQILRDCIKELQVRFLPNQPNFIIKSVDKDGIQTIDFGADPADN